MANAYPVLSIGLPIYNGADFVSEALDSLLAQTFEDFEIIISDNASSDRTPEICHAYAAKDSRIAYHRSEENLGAARNYNRAFELSTGKYFKWAAHDDLCDPTYFEKCIDILEKDDTISLCYANTTVINPAGEPTGHYTEDLHLQSNKPSERYQNFHQRFRKKYKCNAVFGIMPRAILQETALIGYYEASDITLLGELALRGKLTEIPEYLFYRRDHPKMSGRANPTAESIAAWFDPTNQRKLVLPMNRLLREHVRAVARTPMNPLEKAKCLAHIRTFIRWKRREIAQEFKHLIQVSAYSVAHRRLNSGVGNPQKLQKP